MAVRGNDIKIVNRLFFVWEDEKETKWLNEMSRSGWHFQSISGLTKYIFTKGEPKNIIYQLDYNTSFNLDSEYLQIYKDSGWNYLGSMFSWQYFCKEYEEDGVNEIFTENIDKIKRNKKILWVLSPIAILNLYLAIQNFFIHIHGRVFEFDLFIPAVNFFCTLLLIFSIVKIVLRNNKIKNQRF